MRALIEELCSDRCAGRAAGSEGGRIARGLVLDALRAAGTDPHEQPIARSAGVNVLASIPSDLERYVMVAAHYDHLGKHGPKVFRGTDDNAAAVAILVELARRLSAKRPRGRGVIFAAFDAEEPPHFLSSTMGSQFYCHHPSHPLERIDMMVCLELVGHALGVPGLPDAVRRSIFLLGGERSAGTLEQVQSLSTAEPELIVRPADAEVIPPLSDYEPFWRRHRPFVLLTGGRTRHYHTPEDIPEHLFDRIGAVARWLERFVRDVCARDEAPIAFLDRRHDVSTLESLIALLTALAPRSDMAEMGLDMARRLRRSCGRDGLVRASSRPELDQLVGAIETALS